MCSVQGEVHKLLSTFIACETIFVSYVFFNLYNATQSCYSYSQHSTALPLSLNYFLNIRIHQIIYYLLFCSGQFLLKAKHITELRTKPKEKEK